MTLSTDNYVEMKIAHLQMLQDVITRMANYSASVKNYALTIGAALLAVYASEWSSNESIDYALIPLIAFMILDARYLSLERAFRAAYDTARGLPPEATDFAITPPVKEPFDPIILLSWSIAGFYFPLVIIFIIIGS